MREDMKKLSTLPVVTDALGRKLPTFDEVGAKRVGKKVGVFYYVWQGYHGDKVYNIPEILAANPEDPQWGPVGAYHFWGEPEAGYYRSDDPWVIRRNLQMLSDADVDFIFFDVTNGPIYLETVTKLCEISLQMRSEGIATPEVTFITNTNSGQVTNRIYDEFYALGLYEELWFRWDGKPLMLCNFDDPELRDEVKAFFAMRFSWAWTDTVNQPNHWQWLHRHPQDYGWSKSPDVPEQMTVSVAHHPANPYGQSFHKGQQPPVNERYVTEYTGQGLQFAEQWERALEVDPEVVMVTQFNEWIAMRFIWDRGDGEYAGRPIVDGNSHFVDVFTQEFNRDLEPMKDGHTDNLYYQLVSYVRKFKGMAEPEVLDAKRDIVIDGNFAEWQTVSPVYRDAVGDTLHRDWPGYDPAVQYVNKTGRNDIVESRVAYDHDNIYFYVKTAAALTPHTNGNWMHLYLDVDCSKATGWEGYDYAVNLSRTDDRETKLSKLIDGEWQVSAGVDYRYGGNEMEIAIPRAWIDQEEEICFEFKWADNLQEWYDVREFMVSGDVAPARRGNYLFAVK